MVWQGKGKGAAWARLAMCESALTDTVSGKHKGRRQLGRPKRRWKDNIKGDREVIRARGLDSRCSRLDRLATFLETVMESSEFLV